MAELQFDQGLDWYHIWPLWMGGYGCMGRSTDLSPSSSSIAVTSVKMDRLNLRNKISHMKHFSPQKERSKWENEAVHSTTACRGAGAVMRFGCLFGKNFNSRMNGRTDGWTDQPTSQWTDQHRDQPTKWHVECAWLQIRSTADTPIDDVLLSWNAKNGW